MSEVAELLLADSELAAIGRVGPDLHIRLSAACFCEAGARHYQSGWVVVLRLAEGPDCAEFGALDSAELLAAGRRWLRLPRDQPIDGPLRLALQFRRGGTWAAEAQGLELRAPAAPLRHEDLAC